MFFNIKLDIFNLIAGLMDIIKKILNSTIYMKQKYNITYERVKHNFYKKYIDNIDSLKLNDYLC